MLRLDFTVGVDSAHHRALKTTLQIDLDATRRMGDRDLLETLVGRAQCILIFRAQRQRRGTAWSFPVAASAVDRAWK